MAQQADSYGADGNIIVGNGSDGAFGWIIRK